MLRLRAAPRGFLRCFSTTNARNNNPGLAPPLSATALAAEDAEFSARVAALEAFFASPRFAGLTRPYTAADVASKQGSLPGPPPVAAPLALKLHAALERASAEGRPVLTLGALDPVQMTQMARHLEAVYVSGWAASSVLTTANNEVGPDLGCVRAGLGATHPMLTAEQRLPVHHRSESSASYLPRSGVARPEALR
jgi:hypothetical protein